MYFLTFPVRVLSVFLICTNPRVSTEIRFQEFRNGNYGKYSCGNTLKSEYRETDFLFTAVEMHQVMINHLSHCIAWSHCLNLFKSQADKLNGLSCSLETCWLSSNTESLSWTRYTVSLPSLFCGNMHKSKDGFLIPVDRMCIWFPVQTHSLTFQFFLMHDESFLQNVKCLAL